MSGGADCISRFSDHIKQRRRGKGPAVVLIFNLINRTKKGDRKIISALFLWSLLLGQAEFNRSSAV
jgi:hypothetical protein